MHDEGSGQRRVRSVLYLPVVISRLVGGFTLAGERIEDG